MSTKKKEEKENEYHTVKILAFNLVNTNKVIVYIKDRMFGPKLEQINVSSLFKLSGTFFGFTLGKNKSISKNSKAILLGFNPSTDEFLCKQKDKKNNENFRVVSKSSFSWTQSRRNKIDGFRVGDIVKPKSYHQGCKAKILALDKANKKAYVEDLKTKLYTVFSLNQLSLVRLKK